MEAVQVNISDEKSPGGIPAVADSGTPQDKRSAAGLPVAFLPQSLVQYLIVFINWLQVSLLTVLQRGCQGRVCDLLCVCVPWVMMVSSHSLVPS